MGQKINPNGFRFGINKNWQSRWVASNNLQTAQWIVEDDKVRNYFNKQFKIAQIDRIEIERSQTTFDIFAYCGQPGLILGKEGANVKSITLSVNKIVGRKIKINFNVIQYLNIAWSAKIIAREIADAIEGRVSFRVAQKQAIRKVMSSKALGVKTNVSGRLGGAEMAREEGYSEGIIPMNTIRSDLDYALEEANTTYGKIGVKVWINRGEIFKKGLNNQNIPQKPAMDQRGGFRRGGGRFNNNNRSFTPNQNATPTQAKAPSANVKGGA